MHSGSNSGLGSSQNHPKIEYKSQKTKNEMTTFWETDAASNIKKERFCTIFLKLLNMVLVPVLNLDPLPDLDPEP
jgi:hypothetical protein